MTYRYRLPGARCDFVRLLSYWRVFQIKNIKHKEVYSANNHLDSNMTESG